MYFLNLFPDYVDDLGGAERSLCQHDEAGEAHPHQEQDTEDRRGQPHRYQSAFATAQPA